MSGLRKPKPGAVTGWLFAWDRVKAAQARADRAAQDAATCPWAVFPFLALWALLLAMAWRLALHRWRRSQRRLTSILEDQQAHHRPGRAAAYREALKRDQDASL